AVGGTKTRKWNSTRCAGCPAVGLRGWVFVSLAEIVFRRIGRRCVRISGWELSESPKCCVCRVVATHAVNAATGGCRRRAYINVRRGSRVVARCGAKEKLAEVKRTAVNV